VHISAKVDYGLRALLVLAASDRPLTAREIAFRQGIPPRFLGAILTDLRRGLVVTNRRGQDGGFQLARKSSSITLAQVVGILEGPFAEIRGQRPEEFSYPGAARHLCDVWATLRESIQSVLERMSLADVIEGRVPASP